jgi:hypothetical protein
VRIPTLQGGHANAPLLPEGGLIGVDELSPVTGSVSILVTV